MKVTITQDEARELSRRWLETTLDQNIQIDLLPVESSVAHISPEHKIALIKFARQLATDICDNKVLAATFGLAEAKKYVETYHGW